MLDLFERQACLERIERSLGTIKELCPVADREHYNALDWWVCGELHRTEAAICDQVANDCLIGAVS